MTVKRMAAYFDEISRLCKGLWITVEELRIIRQATFYRSKTNPFLLIKIYLQYTSDRR